MVELDLAFMAGFFAGEGSISIVIGKFPDGTCYPNMHTGFATTEKCWSDWFYSYFGGHQHTYPPKNEKCKSVFFWRVGGDRAEKFLRAIQPFLKGEKVQQLELALEYRAKKAEIKSQGLRVQDQTELWESFKRRLKDTRRAAAETNRKDACATQSDSPIPEVIPES